VTNEVAPDKLRHVCHPSQLGFETTAQVRPSAAILGQECALRALRLGLNTRSVGFNIYVSGQSGTGRTTAVMSFLAEAARERPVPADWCYINNFHDPYHPKAIGLPAGRGNGFRQDMATLVNEIGKRIPQLFEGEQYSERREAIQDALERERQRILADLARTAQQSGFFLQVSPTGLTLVPLLGDRPMTEEEFAKLDRAEQQQIVAQRGGVETQVGAAMKRVQALEKQAREKVQDLQDEVVLSALRPLVDELRDAYKDSPDVLAYLDAVQSDLLQNAAAFAVVQERPPNTPDSAAQRAAFNLRRYAVNVVVDNSQTDGAPVIAELNPSYDNLFGRIEREAEFGTLVTNFTMLKAGTLHRANGGYLVLPVEELLSNAGAWEGLKRALRSRQIVIEEGPERTGGIPVKGVRPQAIPLDIKVILIGGPGSHLLLHDRDPDFRELFKVKADFDVSMQRTPQNVQDLMGFVSALCEREGLHPLRCEAAARIVEYASWLAEDQERLTTHFGDIADVVREADCYAGQDSAAHIAEQHIQRAIQQRIERSNLMQRHLLDEIAEGALQIDTDGQVVGQVNGLYVMDVGDYEFGGPRRITASVGMGKEGVLDIEDHVHLAGPVHAKGGLILVGYLNSRYAQDKPLNLSASIVFEQSYHQVEGDSASCAELCALLSALSGLPINQSLALTGSVDQLGRVQAIGAVNEKIEGFFELCRARGLHGKHGVIIPRTNVRNLMLKEEVVQAVRDGRFHVFAIDSVDEAMQLLTGVQVGERGPDGAFPEGTLNAMVDARLCKLTEGLHKFEA